MKTQVIQLEPHDDVISVRDKMSWAKTERILLVIPRGTALRARLLDLRLLQRHAGSVGAQLALVTRADEIRLIARELGIPVFGRLSRARRVAWPGDQSAHFAFRQHEPPDLRRMQREAFPVEAAWREKYGYRFLFFTLAVLAVLAVLLLFVPTATIRLSPVTHLQSLDFTASAGPEITAVDLQGRLPARQSSLVVEQTRTIPATGSVAYPVASAKGTVQFRNLTTSAVEIPAGTVVSTQEQPALHFVTTDAAQVAAGFGKTTAVAVQAVEPGSAGNLPAGALVAMQVDLGTSLSVTNPQPTSGGSDRMAVIPTTADRTALRAALLADILTECKAGLQKILAPGDVFFPGSLEVSQVLTETYFPPEGQAGDAISLTLRLQCQAQFALAADVRSLAGLLLNVGVPAGFTPVSGGLVVEAASLPVMDTAGLTHWDIHAQSLIEARLDPSAAVRLSAGHRPAVAAQKLADSLPLIGVPVIQLKPGWWPWLPLVPFNITVSTGG